MAVPPQDPGVFEYRPLNTESREIRLIRFLSREKRDDNEDSILDIKVEHISLNDKPNYFTLSYVWGDPTPCYPIRLNGRFLNVTKNLFAALAEIEKKNMKKGLCG
jgi:hypothetical protein